MKPTQNSGAANLKPFKPGQSGNPGGVPKRALKLRKLILKHGEKAIATVLEVMENGEPRDRLAAAKCILDFVPKEPEKRQLLVKTEGAKLKPDVAAKLAALQ